MFFKTEKVRSEKHRRFIASLPCCVCGGRDVQAAHIRRGNGGGMGYKPCDSNCVPLCCECHAEQGRIGEPKFWGERLDKAKALAKALFEVTGKREEALNLIKEFTNE